MAINRIQKAFVVLSTVSLLATGCGGGEVQGDLSLFDKNSILVGTPKPDPNNPLQSLPELKENLITAPLQTYHLKDKGDIPYVEASEYVSAVNVILANLVDGKFTAEVKDGLLYIDTKDKNGEIIFDAKKDEVKLKNSQAFARPVSLSNNNVYGDYCSFRENSIQESSATKVYKIDGSPVNEYETYSFKNYGFDIYEKDNKYYLPFEASIKLMFRDIGVDFAYNGKEFYLNGLASFTSSLINSSKGYWKSFNGIYQPSKSKGEDEAYRFQYEFEVAKVDNPEELEKATKFMRLINDERKSAYCMAVRGTEFDQAKAFEDVETSYSYTWKKEGELLIIRVVDQTGNQLGDYQIHLDETRFLAGTISKEVSEYNYNILRFLFDNIYGLKEVKGYTDADSYFATLGVKEGLKSQDSSAYNTALAKLIGKVDDGHSSYAGMSPYTKYDEAGNLVDLNQQYRQERVTKIYQKQAEYAKARINKYKELNPEDPQAGNTDPNYYQGLRFSSSKETAVLTFDAFQHSEMKIKNMKEMYPNDDPISEDAYLYDSRSSMIRSTADGFTTAFKILKDIKKTTKTVKNVVVDLTNNGGGMIAVLPYIEAFFSDDPTYVLKDTVNGTIREYHYKVDINGDGVYGGEGDTFKGQFNYFFLTSGFSFSCGNCFPGFAKDNGIKIIGEKSGGGTSPVGVFFDGLGSAINLSNYLNMSYKGADGKYMQNDAGIPLDYEFPLNNGNWYDTNAIETFLKTIIN